MTTHGMTGTPEFKSWGNMKERCYNPNADSYPRYGGSGITVCDEWKDSFETFYKDMGPRPTLEHTIDRMDGTKGYSKNNCRWATKIEQANNFSNNIHCEYLGRIQTLPNWCRELNLDYNRIRGLMKKYKISLEEAINHKSAAIPVYEYRGEMVRLCDWCKENNINYQWAMKQIKLYNASLENVIKLSSISKNDQYTIDGTTETISWWCFHTKTNPRMLIYRLLDNWTIEEALTHIEDKVITFDAWGDGKGAETKTLEEWCGTLDLDKNRTYLRVLRGENFEDIVRE